MTYRRWLEIKETTFNGRFMNHRFVIHKLVEPISEKSWYEIQMYGDDLALDANHYHPQLFPCLVSAITEANCWIEDAENFKQCPQLIEQKELEHHEFNV